MNPLEKVQNVHQLSSVSVETQEAMEAGVDEETPLRYICIMSPIHHNS